MHIIIGFLTTLAGLIWALHALQNSGFDLNSLNPFYYARRRKWQSTYGERPILNIDEPMTLGAVMAVGIAGRDGAITRETKNTILDMFQTEFGLQESGANELYISASHLLKGEDNLVGQMTNIVKRSKSSVSEEQYLSIMSLMKKVGSAEGIFSEDQSVLMDAFASQYTFKRSLNSKWS
ncbi:hypothetical protein A9Q99_03305 [Gammaproteobacteria bacterium 45_16_T64]|nr:hypothetical protein A9Q99_03305 [Gammaproteobacteria bacterium 45_16_T64]